LVQHADGQASGVTIDAAGQWGLGVVKSPEVSSSPGWFLLAPAVPPGSVEGEASIRLFF
jgi:hypothetical protein